jgi:hypothetical protein
VDRCRWSGVPSRHGWSPSGHIEQLLSGSSRAKVYAGTGPQGPLLDTLCARLMRCGNLARVGKPFTEHPNIPDLRPDPGRPAWPALVAAWARLDMLPTEKIPLWAAYRIAAGYDGERLGNGGAAAGAGCRCQPRSA